MSTGLVLLQHRQEQNRDAQLTLSNVGNELNQLQGLAWQVEDPRYGTPREMRARMAAAEAAIEARVEALPRAAPAELAQVDAALRANFAALERIVTTGVDPNGWDTPKTVQVAAAQSTTLAAASQALDAVGRGYARRARVGEWESGVGVFVATFVLLGAFIFFFRRSELARRKLQAQARTDPLTGLANRGAFTDGMARRLQETIARPPVVLFIDLDGFKDVNDTLGHSAGDAVLREIGQRLERSTRAGDLCARLGGDEFAVVLHDADDAAAEDFAQRIAATLAEPVVVGGRTARTGASIGVAAAEPGVELETLTHWADVAMYAAKADGGGRIEVFDPELLVARAARAGSTGEV